jgi:3-dehydroquinate dehydratase type I
VKICIPIREGNLSKAKQQVKKASKHADFVEIWLDNLKENAELFSMVTKPVIVVCRAGKEHGNFKGSEKDRIEVLKQAVTDGSHFVDVGINTNKKLINDLKKTCKKHGAKLIVSLHVWNKTPDLEILFKEVERANCLGADIVKIAAFVKKWKDNVTLFELVKRAVGEGKKVIVVGMGEKGKISRVGCPLLGSFLTYVALDEKSRTAEGQMTVKEVGPFVTL